MVATRLRNGREKNPVIVAVDGVAADKRSPDQYPFVRALKGGVVACRVHNAGGAEIEGDDAADPDLAAIPPH
jgi:hypothetical protein